MLNPNQIEEALRLLKKAFVLATFKYIEAKKWGWSEKIPCHYEALNEFRNKLFIVQNIDQCEDIEPIFCNIIKISSEYMSNCENQITQEEITNIINTEITGQLKTLLDHLGPCLFTDTDEGVNPFGEPLCDRLQVFTDNIGDLAGDLAELQTDVAALQGEEITSVDSSIKITVNGSGDTDLSVFLSPQPTVFTTGSTPKAEIFALSTAVPGMLRLGIGIINTTFLNCTVNSATATSGLTGNPQARLHWDGLVELNRSVVAIATPSPTSSIWLLTVPAGMEPTTTIQIPSKAYVHNNVTNRYVMVNGLIEIFTNGRLGFAIFDEYFYNNSANLDPGYILYLDHIEYYRN
jgi:hypothetical protein